MLEKPMFGVAIPFYLLFAVGIVSFTVVPGWRQGRDISPRATFRAPVRRFNLSIAQGETAWNG